MKSRRFLAWLPAALALAACAGAAPASPHRSCLPLASWQDWWLNTNYAEHGKSADQIFYFIFWLTTAILVFVQAALVWFMIKYRSRPGAKKAVYLHGNTRLEMVWTIIPAIILIVVALWTKRAWDNYRYSATANDPNAPKILVIGEQYKWNVLYGGPRNKIGRYLVYPKTTDLTWPKVPEGQSFPFPNVPGPAYLPEEEAAKILGDYIGQFNPLGRDFDDPDTNLDPSGENRDLGKLNDPNNALGRALVLPQGRAVEIQLGSKDVIHDFFLPNFRTRLDVVPGMRGKLYVTATKDCAVPRLYTLDELDALLAQKKELIAIVNQSTTGAELYSPGRRKPKYWRLADKGHSTFLTNGAFITSETIKTAQAAGLKALKATIAYDLVCEELCGLGHSEMRGRVIVLDEATLKEPPYINYFPAPPGASNTAATPQDASHGGLAVMQKP